MLSPVVHDCVKKREMGLVKNDTNLDGWKNLCILGGAAALVAGILFRRNLAVEVGMFSKVASPIAVSDWYALLQTNRLLGLTYLHVFDLVNYALVGLMFLALYAVLKRVNKSSMVMAIVCVLLGIGVYFSSNTAFSMLSLSDQYVAATTEAQQNLLLSSGQTMLSLSRFSSPGAHPGTGGLISLFLVAVGGMIASIVMLRSGIFKRYTACVGILASTLDLAYCISYVFVPIADGKLLAVLFIPAAGLFLMLWHIMIGWRLCHLARIQHNMKIVP